MKSKYFVTFSSILILFIFLGFYYSRGVKANLSVGNNFIYFPIVAEFDPWLEFGMDSAINGGISNTGTVYGAGQSLAIAPDGTPCVTWANQAFGEGEIYIRCWDGSTWAEVGTGSASGGGISNTVTDSLFPDIAIAPDGTLYVAWTEDWQNIYIRHWNGSAWQEVGEGSASSGGISNSVIGGAQRVSLAIAPNGMLYAAWDEWSTSTGYPAIYIRVWNGMNWETVGDGSASGGGISNTTETSRFPFLAISPNGKLYVAWQYTNEGGDILSIYVRSWNGNIWEEVGLGSAMGEGISEESNFVTRPSLVISNNEIPYISYIGTNDNESVNTFRTKRWNGIAWELVGDGWQVDNSLLSNAEQSSITLSTDGFPCVAWSANSENWDTTDIYAKCWNGADWVKKGDYSDAKGGISNNIGFSISPDAALAPDGTMYVTWIDDGLIGYSYHQIYARYNP